MDTLRDHERRVLDAIDQDELLDSVCALVSIPSLGGFETPAQEWVADLLLRIGLEVDVWELDFSALSEHPGYSTEIDRDHGLGVVGRVGEEAGGRPHRSSYRCIPGASRGGSERRTKNGLAPAPA